MDPARTAPEAAWLALGDPNEILRRLAREHQVTAQKQRLFTCACLRHMHSLLPQLPNAPMFDVAEQLADDLATREQLRTFQIHAPLGPERVAALWALEAMHCLREDNFVGIVEHAARAVRDQARGRNWAAAQKQQTVILCDILGHLLHGIVVIEPRWLEWNDATVRKMATAIYQDNSFADVPILADALEEAGCENPALLHHCRAKIRHFRGCWVVDALLGKK